MVKDVEFSWMQKVMISGELFSQECFFQLKTFSGWKYFLAAKFQVAQGSITQSF